MAEKVTITVSASGAHPNVLTVQDAMRQVLDLFDLLSPDDHQQFAWRLSYASTNSPFTAQGEAVSFVPDVDVTVIARTQKLELLKDLTEVGRGEVPDRFRAGKPAEILKNLLKRNLNGVGTTEVQLFDNFEPLTVTPRFAEAAMQRLEVKQLPPDDNGLRLGRAREERGTVEGYFREVGLHHRHPAICIIERKSKREIWCRIDDQLRDKIVSEADYNDVWSRQRIRVKGKISYDREGRIYRVIATQFDRVNSPKISLDKLYDPDFTNGLSAAEYLDILREGHLADRA